MPVTFPITNSPEQEVISVPRQKTIANQRHSRANSSGLKDPASFTNSTDEAASGDFFALPSFSLGFALALGFFCGTSGSVKSIDSVFCSDEMSPFILLACAVLSPAWLACSATTLFSESRTIRRGALCFLRFAPELAGGSGAAPVEVEITSTWPEVFCRSSRSFLRSASTEFISLTILTESGVDKMLSLILIGMAASSLSIGVLLSYAASSAIYYRPLPHLKGCDSPGSKLREIDETQCPYGLLFARFVVCSVVTSAMKWIMTFRNTFEVASALWHFSPFMTLNRNCLQIVRDSHSAYLFDAMRHRPVGTALITVGNHVSSMDDPGLLGKYR